MHSLEAELSVVRDGLQLVINNQFAPICVEMDALAAIQLIVGLTQPRHSLGNVIHDCRYFMRQLGVKRIDHVYHEGNKCADLLANMDFHDGLDFHIFDVAPYCIILHLCDDRNGVEYPRLLYDS
ncbi:hypothetical protein RHMOL_Rhmol13G0173700 [Rhododendron molle]|uniref:Uncharacterized protein n=1 Tax=Rhododendron molle TaxID=49168 RepID=A0ACC0L7R3_RHOML|nr:hypothetical protein RHMOL_Rhmol13G0173700 [Rhododendron molle]